MTAEPNRARCLICDREHPTDEEWESIPEGGGVGLCWHEGTSGCVEHAVDWRERALQAEAKLAEVTRKLDDTVGTLERVDEMIERWKP